MWTESWLVFHLRRAGKRYWEHFYQKRRLKILTLKSLQLWQKDTVEVILRFVYFDIINKCDFYNIYTRPGINYQKQNFCSTAAYRPVRELIKQEREKDMVKFINLSS